MRTHNDRILAHWLGHIAFMTLNRIALFEGSL